MKTVIINTFIARLRMKLREIKKNYDFCTFKDNIIQFKDYIFNTIEKQAGMALIKEIIIDQVYEFADVKIEPTDIVLDCGANIGVFTIYASKKAKMVYAFEPSPNESKILEENKKINKSDNIKVIEKGILDISIDAKLSLCSTGSFIDNFKPKYLSNNIINIKTISIDEFINQERLEKVDFIKMDIEGSEKKALFGAKEVLKKFKPKLAICAYHNFDDFYKISILIKKLNSKYKLRIQDQNGFLTIYAV